MTWEEILNCERYQNFGCTCGGWHQYTKKENLKAIPSGHAFVYKAIDETKVIRVRRDKLKYHNGERYWTTSLSQLEEILKTI